MLFIASIHHRRSDICPRTGAQHASSTAEGSWAMLDDGSQLADVAAADADPEMFALLQELRAAIPIATLGVAICRQEDFPSPAGVCNFHGTNPQKHCGASPEPRPMEISTVVPGRDCRQPKARCPRCTEKFHYTISAVLHSHLGTQPPAPIQPPAPRVLTPAEIAAAARENLLSSVEGVLVGVANRTMPPRQAASALVSAIEEIAIQTRTKETH